MPPEVAENLLVLDLRLDHEILMASSERLTASAGGRLLMSWYSETCPSNYMPVFDGVVYVKEATIADRSEAASVRVRNDNGVFTWRDYCDAFVLLFPAGIGAGMRTKQFDFGVRTFTSISAWFTGRSHGIR